MDVPEGYAAHLFLVSTTRPSAADVPSTYHTLRDAMGGRAGRLPFARVGDRRSEYLDRHSERETDMLILKWRDWSGATHIESDIRKAVSYGQRHIAEAQAIAEVYDGIDMIVARMIGPDVYNVALPEAAKRFGFEPSCGPDDLPTTSVTANTGVDYDNPWLRLIHVPQSIRSDEVTVVSMAERSYGMYVIVTMADGDRRHLLLDATVAWLMNEQGATIDRFGD